MKAIEKTIIREVLSPSMTQVISVHITVYAPEEALRLYRMGYLDEATLVIAGIPLPDEMKKGSPGYNMNMRGKIEKAIKEYFGYDVAVLCRKSRKHELVFARNIAIYLLCKYTSFILKEIGTMYGGCDHSFAINGREAILGYISIKGYSQEKETINDFLSRYNFEYDTTS